MIELMITVLIAAIVLSIALPSLTSVSNEVSFNSVRQRLILDLTYTRSEAVNQGGQIVICPSDFINSPPTSCSADLTNWSNGWIVFEDRDNNGLFDSSDEMLKNNRVDSNAAITWERSNAISFDGEGHATSTSAGTFKICDARGNTNIAKGVTLSLSGRARSTDSVTCP